MGVRDRRIKHKDGSVTVMRYITWYLPGSGKPVTRSLGPASKITKTRAKEILTDIISDLRKNKYEKYTADDPMFSDYAKDYIKYARDIQKKRSWDRDRIVIDNLLESFNGLRLSEITSDKIVEYQGKRLGQGKKPRTVNLELSCLNRMYNIADLQGKYKGSNPVKRVKALDQHYDSDRILTAEEEHRLMQAAPPYLGDIIVCALNTGMRRGEMLTLKWQNVNLDHDYLLLESSITKTKRNRRVPVNSILRNVFIRLRTERKGEHVFTDSLGIAPASANVIIYTFKVALRRANITGFRFHDLRHTSATRMVEAGVPLFTVGQILGHRNPQTTMRYAHPDESLKRGVEALVDYNHDNYHGSDKERENGG